MNSREGRGKRRGHACAFWTAMTAIQTATAATVPDSAVSAAQVGQLILGLLVVLAIFGGFALLLRRLPIIRSARNATLKVIETVPLGTRDRLLLIDAEGTRLLIGVTPGSIACLHVLKRGTTTGAGFAGHLQQSMTSGDQDDTPPRSSINWIDV